MGWCRCLRPFGQGQHSTLAPPLCKLSLLSSETATGASPSPWESGGYLCYGWHPAMHRNAELGWGQPTSECR